MHPDNAKRLNIAEGDMATIETGEDSLSLELRLSSSMAPGVIIIPRHHTIPWQIFERNPARINDKQIHRQ